MNMYVSLSLLSNRDGSNISQNYLNKVSSLCFLVHCILNACETQQTALLIKGVIKHNSFYQERSCAVYRLKTCITAGFGLSLLFDVAAFSEALMLVGLFDYGQTTFDISTLFQ